MAPPVPARRPRAQSIVDGKASEWFQGEEEQSVSFHRFMQMQAAIAKESMRQTPSSVPSVRGLSWSKDTKSLLEFSGIVGS